MPQALKAILSLNAALKFCYRLQDINSVVFSIPAILKPPSAVLSSATRISNFTKLIWDPLNLIRSPQDSIPVDFTWVGAYRNVLKKIYRIQNKGSAYLRPSGAQKFASKY